MAKQSRIDARLVLDLFVRCVGGESVVEITFNGAINKFLDRLELTSNLPWSALELMRLFVCLMQLQAARLRLQHLCGGR